ncbi:MAG TPA: DUF1569 domain-containing protein [Vicinamibacterales bacterium]|nr:DUF1569 domain-containing protein [Vicinamibacterales bacterium]
MHPYRSLDAPGSVDELIRRVGRLQPTTARRWGTMSSHEMLCHLADSFLVMLGERPATSADTWLTRSLVKWIALHTPLPWPRGVPTRPEVDPKRAGTPPAEFERDRTKVVDFIQRFALPDTRCVRHPIFGAMTRKEWLLWGYGHVDHHLRQFGL